MSDSAKTYFIIDFDNTFVNAEALDLLAEISLARDTEKKSKIEEIKSLSSSAMEGKINFSYSLERRLQLIKPHKSHIEKLISKLKRRITKSVSTNKNFFKNFSEQIIIVSGGFRDYIVPVVSGFGIPEQNIYANEFIFDNEGKVIGFNKKNPLTQDGGKVKLLKKLNLKGEVIVIGDGYTDYELKKNGIAAKFYAFTENVHRRDVVKEADHVTPSIDEFLYVTKLPMSISYPKNRIKVLLLENIHERASKIFREEGYQVETLPLSLSERELIHKIKDVSILGIRSKTLITENVLKEARKLLAVGAFCIGTNQIDLKACSQRGVIVFNAPFSNTRSVVELVIGEIIMLERGIFPKNKKMHDGIWDKSSRGSNEVRGKKLGIIGYGKIGSQLSVLAEDMGMEVYYYDIVEKLAMGNAKKCRSLKELLKKSDIISIHVDGNPANSGLIGKNEFRQMKDGVILINLSRGFVVDIKELAENIKSGKVKGAAIDVFPEEPESNNRKFFSELQEFDNVILTPHIGGSTEEAQEDIANFVPSKIIDFINSGNSFYSVNFPNIQLPSFENAHRFIHIHHNVPGILAKMNSVFAKHKINITGQYLKTDELIGYVITDISRKYNPELIRELKEIPNTIRLRVLY
ncbi:MAG: phosphoglycerate dehydrogenase [Ignavibacteria bacterium]|nr:phosphoglycerate dehydrogenase [Ignavibacteria bacterium]